MVGESRSVI